METHRKVAIVLGALAFAVSGPHGTAALGQQPDSATVDSVAPRHGGVVVDAGVGWGSMAGSESGPAVRLSAGLLTRAGLFSLRTTEVPDFQLFEGPPETVWDVGLLWGGKSTSAHSYVAASVGLGLAGGTRHGALLKSDCALFLCSSTYEAKKFYRIGVPLEAEMALTLRGALGLGVSGFANLNPVRSAWAFTVGLYAGSLR